MKVVIMQGVPGSGKSTYIAEHLKGAVVVSADHYFDRLGRFDPSLLSAAHGECLTNFNAAVLAKAALIVVDNTNTTPVEVAPYWALAQAYGYEVEIVRIVCDPNVAAARNTHGVPVVGVLAMHERLDKFEGLAPPWWTIKRHSVAML